MNFPLRLLDFSVPYILRIFFSICVLVEESNGKSNLQFSVCTSALKEKKCLISTTTVRVVNSGATIAPAMFLYHTNH